METDTRAYFVDCLRHSTHILALLGAGLSASSGVPTYSGKGARWRDINVRTLSTREAFSGEPRVVWEYYRELQQKVAAAVPNRGHIALAELAKARPNFLAITQNIDDLSQRAGHPPGQMAPLHGSLSATRCFDEKCPFFEPDGFKRHAITSNMAHSTSPLTEADILSLPYPPTCPRCGSSPLRPGMIWYGELLPPTTLDYIDSWIGSAPHLDVMLVVGTAAELSRSAEFIDRAREKGAIVAHFNIELNEDLQDPEDIFFQGDAAITLPAVVGESLGLNL